MRISVPNILFFLFFNLASWLPNLYAQTYISGGPISGIWTPLNNPYIIQGNIDIPAGSSLSIAAGVNILFNGNYHFQVEGNLIANGSGLNPVIISANDTTVPWGGLRFTGVFPSTTDSSLLLHCIISFAHTFAPDSLGGGLSFDNYSRIRIESCEIKNNNAEAKGGGICCRNGASPLMLNNRIFNNHARVGGGVFLDQSNPHFRGLFLANNIASDFGGGIAFTNSANPVFDTTVMLIIYNNYASAAGTDLYAFNEPSLVRVMKIDSFTVFEPDLNFAYPFSKFALTIGHGKIPQLSQDLYVSSDGSDENLGLSFAEPIQTIITALQRIKADSLHPRTIHLDQGEYSRLASNQVFPLNMRSYVNIQGDNSMLSFFVGNGDEYFFRFYNDHNIELKDMHLSGGFAKNGGAIQIENGDTILFDNLKFENNTATAGGGAVYCKGNHGLQINNCEFSFNTAADGGAVSLNATPGPVIFNNAFFYNTATSKGGALTALSLNGAEINESSFLGNSAAEGGACYFTDNCNLKMNSFTFAQNNAISGDGGAILFHDLGLFKLEKGLFQENQALGLGGAIMLTDSVEMQLQNISVIGNLAAGGSAFTGLQHAKLRMINTLITYNVIYPGLSAPSTSIILADNINLEIYNTTIANNTAITGGAALYTTGTQAIIKNSIIWNNEPTGIVDTLSNLAISYSDIGGGWSGTGNIDSDPIFNNDSLGDYSLTAVSPCINTADPDTTGLLLPPTDLNGNPRIAQGLLDMGPLESFFPLISENVSGHIVYGNPAHPTPLPNCTVKLQQGTIVIASTQTDNAGYYLFLEKPAGNYTLKVSSTNPWGGINSIDALLILKHFVGLNILQGLLLKAGNVDNSSNVNAIDAQLVGKRFVGLICSFTAGDWVFDVPQVTIPQSGALDIIIHGVCMGDVNASFIPSY